MPEQRSPSRPSSRAWIGYLVVFIVVLALSGVFTPSDPAKSVPYDQAIALVDQGKVASAVVLPEEVRLTLKPEAPAMPGDQTKPEPAAKPEAKPPPKAQPAEEVRTDRIPGMTSDPLVSALLSKSVPFEAKSPRASWTTALWWIVPLVLINMVFFAMLRRAGPMGGGGPLAMFRSKGRVFDKATQPRVRFADVAGVEEAKSELMEVVEFLKRPERYRALGGRIPRGLLLIGPPGTGKTLLARAVAGEAEVPFISFNASEFVEMFVGLGAARVRELFEQARKVAPSIVFIDEIDAVGRTRGGVGAIATHDEREQTLQQLLAELDGFEPSATVILMAATNRPEVLDPALLRPGRFDRQVIVDRPDMRGREAILKVHAAHVPLAKDVDLAAVARRTPGMVGADLANIVNEAALAGSRRGAERIEQVDFAEAMDRVQLGLRRHGMIMTAEERRRVAYHESGHALVALALPLADPVERVSIVARTIGALGMTIQVPRDERYVATERELESKITVMLGGRAAEELAFGDLSSGAHDDLGRATTLLRGMITRLGMSRHLGMSALSREVGAPMLGTTTEERLCSDATAREIDSEVRERLDELFARAKAILIERRHALETVAEALISRETLAGDEVARLAEIPLAARAA